MIGITDLLTIIWMSVASILSYQCERWIPGNDWLNLEKIHKWYIKVIHELMLGEMLYIVFKISILFYALRAPTCELWDEIGCIINITCCISYWYVFFDFKLIRLRLYFRSLAEFSNSNSILCLLTISSFVSDSIL